MPLTIWQAMPPARHGTYPPVRAMSAPPDSLAITATVDPALPRPGERVTFRLAIRNTTDRTLILYLLGREPTLDVRVREPAGDPVWHRLEGQIIPALLRVEHLPAGGLLEVEAAWDQRRADGRPISAGAYLVEVLLLAEAGPLRAPPLRLEVRPD